jgi:hypothetical protein
VLSPNRRKPDSAHGADRAGGDGLPSQQAKRRRSGPTKETLRNCHAQRYFTDYYGSEFPDDDAGREDLFIALQLRAPRGEGEPTLRQYIKSVAPWITESEAAQLLDRAYAEPCKLSDDALGRKLGLKDADRTRLRISAIGSVDVPRAARLARRAAKKNERRTAKRRAAGMTPRAEYEATSASKTRPWEAFGYSRRTWERKGKPQPPNPVASVAPSNLSLTVGATVTT